MMGELILGFAELRLKVKAHGCLYKLGFTDGAVGLIDGYSGMGSDRMTRVPMAFFFSSFRSMIS
ncbi:MAG: hypothetical protein AAFO91_10835, partial [Bacteroidota bacterium]